LQNKINLLIFPRRQLAAKGKQEMSFKSVASGMAKKQGISKERASAELAASTRNASKAAKKKNPNLKKVKG
jgi:hypothetical protein